MKLLRKNINFITEKKGQIFPFLFLVLVIVIIAVMSYVNMAQVASHKIMVSNAADAGALAGISTIASACNAIVDYNIEVLDDYYSWHEPILAFPYGGSLWVIMSIIEVKDSFWMELVEHQLRFFLSMSGAGLEATGGVLQSGILQALQNLELEEGEKRVGTPQGPVHKSSLESKLQSIDFEKLKDYRSFSFNYTWQPYEYNLTLQRLAKAKRSPEEIDIKVKKPKPPVLLPSDTYIHTGGVFIQSGDCASVVSLLSQAVVELNAYIAVLSDVPRFFFSVGLLLESVFAGELFGFKTDAAAQVQVFLNVLKSFIPMVVFTHIAIPISVCFPIFEGIAFVYVHTSYAIPVKDIGKISIGVSVQVSRFSPTKNLGLWQWQHGNITSGARAVIPEGYEAHSKNSFRANVKEAWDGSKI